MKFFLGFITSTILFLILIIGAWLYFDFPISTNDETETYNPPKEVQQQKYNDHIKEQTSPSQAPVSENNVDTSEDWKEEYDEINEGTDENPYVTIDGQKVDPKFLLEDK